MTRILFVLVLLLSGCSSAGKQAADASSSEDLSLATDAADTLYDPVEHVGPDAYDEDSIVQSDHPDVVGTLCYRLRHTISNTSCSGPQYAWEQCRAKYSASTLCETTMGWPICRESAKSGQSDGYPVTCGSSGYTLKGATCGPNGDVHCLCSCYAL